MKSPAKHCIVLGTRPEIIKLAGIRRLLGTDGFLIHTGQHFDANMSASFFEGSGIDGPEVDLGLQRLGGSWNAIGAMVSAVGDILAQHCFASVIVQGDTHSALAGGLAAAELQIPLVHVEAGLRSNDRRMPEERNRIMLDHLSSLLAAPSQLAVANLLREGIAPERIHLTGNTVVESLLAQVPPAQERERMCRDLDVKAGEFVLATIHRAENTATVEAVAEVLDQLGRLGLPVVFPIHPRTRALLRGAIPKNVMITEPMGRDVFVGLAKESGLIITDSGGVQEEATTLGKHVVVVRETTERPEALQHGAILTSRDRIARTAVPLLDRDDPQGGAWAFGDGLASERVAAAVLAQRF